MVPGGALRGTARSGQVNRAFLDTNVLIYVFDRDEPTKQATATRLLHKLTEAGSVLLSTQVLQEFYAVATGKLRRRLSAKEAVDAVEAFAALPLVTVTPELIVGAVRLHQAESLSFWDALIVQAALAGGAKVLYSEDLQNGRRIGELLIQNPFVGEAGETGEEA